MLLLLAGCGGNDSTDSPDPASGNTEQAAAAQTADLAQVEKETAVQLIRLLSGEDVGPGNEWSIIAIAGSSMGKEAEAQSLFMQYEESLRLTAKRRPDLFARYVQSCPDLTKDEKKILEKVMRETQSIE